MITNFPGSDDTRGTTTRVKIVEPEPEGSGYSAVMRVDELKGVLGEALRSYNMTKFVANTCLIAPVDGVKTLTSLINENEYFDQFKQSISEIESYINNRISEEVLSLDLPEAVTFTVTNVDILNTTLETSGLHNQSGIHTVFMNLNWDVILYGQFSPNPLIEPAPAPEPCACFTPIWNVNAQFPSTNNNGVIIANSDGAGLPYAQGHIFVRAQGKASLNAQATVSTANILTENQFYTLKYDITANQVPILTPGTNSECTIYVNNLIVGVFSLDTVAKSGYMQFLAPTGWASPYTTFVFKYTKAFGDRLSYGSAELMWGCKFELCNASCQNIMP
jgi:hypothetical protein